MKKKLIIIASYQEAFFSIQKLKAYQDKVLNNKFISPKIDIIISGIGIINAITTAIQYYKKYSSIINIGFSGIINEKLSIGEIYEIKILNKLTFSKYFIEKEDILSLNFTNSTFPEIQLLNNSSTSIISSDIPIRNLKTKSFCSSADLVDMEAYGIAFISQKLNFPCKIFKLASDYPSLKGRQFLFKHIKEFSRKISNFIYEII